MPPALRFEVHTDKKSRHEVVYLVEKFSLREGLKKLDTFKITDDDDKTISVYFNDRPSVSKVISVNNSSLNNKEHVEVFIYVTDLSDGCDICIKFEKSVEMKELKYRFFIDNTVKNGSW